MSQIDLTKLDIASAGTALGSGQFTASDLAEEVLKQIPAKNKALNAYLEVFADVEAQVKLADQKITAGQAGPLTGIPLAIKDNILIAGRKVSAASKILTNYVASYDATVISKLKAAGAIFIGRTNMDEFAMGGSTENSAFGPTRNPHDHSRVAGGSSGGSAAAVAANLCLGALGSDTGGSIRQPASFCGVVGLKPTYGAVSRFGLMAMASSLDQIGPMGKSVADTETIFNVIRGYDPKDSTSAPDELGGEKGGEDKVKTVGVPYHFLGEGLAPEVRANFEASLNKLKQLGYQIKEIELPNLKYALAVYYIIMPAEASANLARFDGMRYGLNVPGDNLLGDYLKTRGGGFGPEVKRRIILGTYVLSAGYYDAYYGQATAVRRLLKQDFTQAFTRVEVIALPTAPTTAFKIGAKVNDPLQMYLEDIFTISLNLVGAPGLSIPSGQDSQGLPIGLQLIAPHFREKRLFKVGRDFATI